MIVLAVYTSRLTGTGTKTALFALFRIQNRTKQRIPGQKTQYSPHRTNRIAISPAITPCQNKQNNKSNTSNQKCGQTSDPYFRFIKSITVYTFCKISKQIVAPLPKRSQQILCYTAIRTVRSQQRRYRTDTCNQGDCEKSNTKYRNQDKAGE